ncbi:hypothetical protein FPOAC1_012151 [Fusarium poae]|uniref:hypothetical protein n=1 Tax=Fusarium poae TaxID=36050 RepID=UPI001CEB60F3|nr:hypothetical protein FPOAC1_012151 [Fusarium poae]KAG8667323.1 hypothetical protein FPOAC1_012151 [Fusarium poae]
MRPVERNDVRRLTNRNTILIIDPTSWTIAYIDNIISRNPKNIATKQGSKTLPPELWYMILSWAEDDFAQPSHDLVYPVEITSVQLDGETSEPAVVCNKIPQWWRFGAIRNLTELIHYENYLISPWYDPTAMPSYDPSRTPPPECPFLGISRTVLQNESLTIPIRELKFGRSFLYQDIKAPEVIAWTERGKCFLCHDVSGFCAGCRDGAWALESFDIMSRDLVDCDTGMFCPLCVGPEYAKQSAWENSDQGLPSDKMSEEEYIEWESKRMQELGYHEH